MSLFRKRRLLILSGLVVIVIFILFVALQKLLFMNNEPSNKQNYYTGTISHIEKRNTPVDGVSILYSIILDNNTSFAVTNNTSLYTNQISPIGSDSDPSITFTRIRAEAQVEDLQIGNKVELWDRQVNDHLFEIFELTTLDPTVNLEQ